MIGKSGFNWLIAGSIATLLLVAAIGINSSHSKPCAERQCFSKLDKRLGAIESEMKVRTQDRYTGTDARRDLERLDRRIDALHGEVHKDDAP